MHREGRCGALRGADTEHAEDLKKQGERVSVIRKTIHALKT